MKPACRQLSFAILVPLRLFKGSHTILAQRYSQIKWTKNVGKKWIAKKTLLELFLGQTDYNCQVHKLFFKRFQFLLKFAHDYPLFHIPLTRYFVIPMLLSPSYLIIGCWIPISIDRLKIHRMEWFFASYLLASEFEEYNCPFGFGSVCVVRYQLNGTWFTRSEKCIWKNNWFSSLS